MTNLLSDDEEELIAYTNASKISKKKFMKEVLSTLNDESFDWLGLAHLLSQEDDGGGGINPMHTFFLKKSVDSALSYAKANDLVEQFMASTATHSNCVVEEVEEISEEDMKQLTKENT